MDRSIFDSRDYDDELISQSSLRNELISQSSLRNKRLNTIFGVIILITIIFTGIAAGIMTFQSFEGINEMVFMSGTFVGGSISLFIYLLPGIIAAWRSHQNFKIIMTLNVLAAWTTVFWIVPLIWSLTDITWEDIKNKLNEECY